MALGFADDRLAPSAVEWDRHKYFPIDVLREAAALRMGGIYVREAYAAPDSRGLTPR